MPESNIPKKIGPYEIIQELGKGAMGVVYEGRDPANMPVAVKALRMDVLDAIASQRDRKKMIERFKREMQSAQSIRHLNVISIFASGEDNGLLYIAMERIPDNLARYMDRKNRFETQEIVHICAQVCDGLDAIHRKSIIHRDIKPANILISDQTIKVSDFGIAHIDGLTMTTTGTVIGTPEYMSPEQTLGNKVDARSDLWAVGVILYEMLVGELPFKGETQASLFKSIQKQPPLTPHEYDSGISPVLSAVVMKALDKEPRQRYESAKQMAAALRECLKENPDIAITCVVPESTIIPTAAPSPLSQPKTVPGAPPPPRQLPQNVPDFTGRNDTIDKLLAGVRDGKACAIHGMGGAGKTALAVYLAAQWERDTPDGQIYVDLKGVKDDPLEPKDAMGRIIHSFNPGARLPDSTEELSAMYRSVLRDKRVFFLFDDARDAAQVGPLLPAPPAVTLITSRRPVYLPGALTAPLEGMEPPEAVEFLKKVMGTRGATDAQLESIARLCGHLPLALRAAGVFLATYRDWDVDEYLKELADERTRLENLKLIHDNLDVEATLALSIRQLHKEKPEYAAYWQRLTVFPASFDREAATAVLNIDKKAARDALSDLLRRTLLLFNETTQRYRFHDLLRPMARRVYAYGGQAPTDEQARIFDTENRHAEYFMNVLNQADEWFTEKDSYVKGLALFDRERENIEAGRRWSVDHRPTSETARRLCMSYPNAGIHVLSLRLHPSNLIVWLDDALAISREIGDRCGEGNALGNLGNAYAALGETRKAIEYYDRALAISREIGDRRGEGNRLGSLGNAYFALGETRKAIEYYEQALAISREIGDRRAEGAHLGSLGLAYFALGETRKAIEYYEQALAISREIGDRRGEGTHLGNLGLAYFALGETRKAIDYHEQALAISREIGDRRGEGADLGNLGLAYAGLGETRKAIDYYDRALAIFEQIEDPRAGVIRQNLAQLKDETHDSKS